MSSINVTIQKARSKIPHKWIFYIQSEFPRLRMTKFGTGWLLNPRTIITAAHVLANVQTIGNRIDITIAPHAYISSPLNGGNLFVSYGKNVLIPGRWKDKGFSGSDYAAIRLEPNQQIHGEESFSIQELNSFSNANISGYINRNKYNINSVNCTFIHRDPNFFQYQANAHEGHSGGPLYINNNGNFQVIGTHKGVVGGICFASVVDGEFKSFISNL